MSRHTPVGGTDHLLLHPFTTSGASSSSPPPHLDPTLVPVLLASPTPTRREEPHDHHHQLHHRQEVHSSSHHHRNGPRRTTPSPSRSSVTIVPSSTDDPHKQPQQYLLTTSSTSDASKQLSTSARRPSPLHGGGASYTSTPQSFLHPRWSPTSAHPTTSWPKDAHKGRAEERGRGALGGAVSNPLWDTSVPSIPVSWNPSDVEGDEEEEERSLRVPKQKQQQQRNSHNDQERHVRRFSPLHHQEQQQQQQQRRLLDPSPSSLAVSRSTSTSESVQRKLMELQRRLSEAPEKLEQRASQLANELRYVELERREKQREHTEWQNQLRVLTDRQRSLDATRDQLHKQMDRVRNETASNRQLTQQQERSLRAELREAETKHQGLRQLLSELNEQLDVYQAEATATQQEWNRQTQQKEREIQTLEHHNREAQEKIQRADRILSDSAIAVASSSSYSGGDNDAQQQPMTVAGRLAHLKNVLADYQQREKQLEEYARRLRDTVESERMDHARVLDVTAAELGHLSGHANILKQSAIDNLHLAQQSFEQTAREMAQQRAALQAALEEARSESEASTKELEQLRSLHAAVTKERLHYQQQHKRLHGDASQLHSNFVAPLIQKFGLFQKKQSQQQQPLQESAAMSLSGLFLFHSSSASSNEGPTAVEDHHLNDTNVSTKLFDGDDDGSRIVKQNVEQALVAVMHKVEGALQQMQEDAEAENATYHGALAAASANTAVHTARQELQELRHHASLNYIPQTHRLYEAECEHEELRTTLQQQEDQARSDLDEAQGQVVELRATVEDLKRRILEASLHSVESDQMQMVKIDILRKSVTEARKDAEAAEAVLQRHQELERTVERLLEEHLTWREADQAVSASVESLLAQEEERSTAEWQQAVRDEEKGRPDQRLALLRKAAVAKRHVVPLPPGR